MAKRDLPKSKKKDRAWQEKVAKKLEKEKIKFGYPRGMERFENVIKRSKKAK